MTPIIRTASALTAEKSEASTLLKRGTAVSILGQLFRTALQITSVIVLSRLLPPSDFGVIAVSLAIISIGGVFTDIGLTAATVQARQISQSVLSTLFALSSASGVSIFVLLYFLSGSLTEIFGGEVPANVIIINALTIPILALSSQHNALMQRSMKWVEIQIIGFFAQLIGFVFSLFYIIYIEVNYFGVIYGYVLTAATQSVLIAFAARWLPGLHFRPSEAAAAIRLGAYLSAFNFLNFAHRQFDNVAVGAFSGSIEAGYYSRSYALFTLPIAAIVWPLNPVLVSALSRLQDEPERALLEYQKILVPIQYLVSMGAALMFLSAENLSSIVFGPGWGPTAEIIRVLSIVLILQPVYTSVGAFFIAFGNTRRKFLAAIPASVVYIIAFVIGARWGGFGTAVAYLIAMSLVTPFWLWAAISPLKIKLFRFIEPFIPAYMLAVFPLLNFYFSIDFQNYFLDFSLDLFAVLISSAITLFLMCGVPVIRKQVEFALSSAKEFTYIIRENRKN